MSSGLQGLLRTQIDERYLATEAQRDRNEGEQEIFNEIQLQASGAEGMKQG